MISRTRRFPRLHALEGEHARTKRLHREQMAKVFCWGVVPMLTVIAIAFMAYIYGGM